MVTPFVPGDNDEIDLKGTKKVVEYLINGGIDGIFALGTCGEFAAIDNRTKRIFLEVVQEAIEDRIPLFVGITETSTERCLRFYREIAGIKPLCVVVSSPFYYLYSQNEIVSFFLRIADSVDVPLILYDIPQFVKNNISLEILETLVQHPNIVGLKDSSGNFSRFQEIITLFQEEGFKVFQGIENLSAVSLMAGASGLVPGLANVAPSWFSDMWNMAGKKKWEEIFAIQKKVNQLASVFDYQPWIGGLKQALEVLGKCSGKPHHPLKQLDSSDKNSISQLLRSLIPEVQ